MTIREKILQEVHAAEKKEVMSRDWRVNQIAFLLQQLISEREELASKSNGQH